jgi:Bifunctional DNA primase/polymerase, N-terminal
MSANDCDPPVGADGSREEEVEGVNARHENSGAAVIRQPQSRLPDQAGRELVCAALQLARHGWSVFRLRRRDKRPLRHGWQHEASDDLKKVESLWRESPDSNIGVLTGKRFWVMDVDVPDGLDSIDQLQDQHGWLPLTAATVTPSGGEHFLFTVPGDFEVNNSQCRLGPGLDVRGLGGYFTAPPSLSATGIPYLWQIPPWQVPPAEPPQWLVALLRPAPQPAPVRPSIPVLEDPVWGPKPRYSRAALDRACEHILAAPDGEQCSTLYREAFALGGLAAAGLMPTFARDVLVAAGMRMRSFRPREPWTRRRVERDVSRGWAAGLAHPRAVREARR